MHILYEDNHLIAAEKRAGQTVQPEPGKPLSLEEEVKAYIKEKYNKPGAVFLGVIHRIDMPVSGIVLFAKTSKALERMNKIFEQRQVSKVYTAVVENVPPEKEATITHWLKRDDKRKLVKAFEQEVGGSEKAQLIYQIEKVKQGKSQLKIRLLTGRKHQIRAQLSAIGCPIVGDVKYQAAKAFTDHRIWLHASELSFEHPVTGEKILIQSKPEFDLNYYNILQ
jgi:23S rRNA pseudouridine1911/1915/1917 synthase